MVRDRVVFPELKNPRGRLKKTQAAWLCALRAAGAERTCGGRATGQRSSRR
jgi:hypothetical protein